MNRLRTLTGIITFVTVHNRINIQMIVTKIATFANTFVQTATRTLIFLQKNAVFAEK